MGGGGPAGRPLLKKDLCWRVERGGRGSEGPPTQKDFSWEGGKGGLWQAGGPVGGQKLLITTTRIEGEIIYF